MRVAQESSHLRLAIAWFAVTAGGLRIGHVDPYYTINWGSTYRIATKFTAGALTYLSLIRPAAVRSANAYTPRRVVVPPSSPRWSSRGRCSSRGLPAAQPPANAVNPDAEPLTPYFHLALVPLLVAWIGALALARSGVARALSTRTLVLGGFVSYSST